MSDDPKVKDQEVPPGSLVMQIPTAAGLEIIETTINMARMMDPEADFHMSLRCDWCQGTERIEILPGKPIQESIDLGAKKLGWEEHPHPKGDTTLHRCSDCQKWGVEKRITEEDGATMRMVFYNEG